VKHEGWRWWVPRGCVGLFWSGDLAQNGGMGVELPEIGRKEFSRRLQACSPASLSAAQVEGLYLHYSELRRWNRRVSLVGPVDEETVVERHYGESLSALPLLSGPGRVLVDLGSGAGFPGFVLAVARPDVNVTLVEARGRKWSFLMSACRAAALSCNCLNVRVDTSPVEGLPQEIDWITARAVRFEDLGLSVLLPRLNAGGSLLLWSGIEKPELSSPLRFVHETHLAGSNDRRILEIVKDPESLRGA
jgi:16S rRNA (guanine527-N7)-methyltransferase